MNRIGIATNRSVAILAAILLATTGIASVMAQALGPAGPSPATENASVVAQAMVQLPEGEAAWRLRNIEVDDATPALSTPYPAFVTNDGVPIIVEDKVTGLRQRVASGEAAVIVPYHETSIVSLGPRQTVTVIDVLPADEATLTDATGSISSTFEMSGGSYDVDLIRIALDEGETSTVPMGNGPSQIVVRSGQADFESSDESFTMAAGSDRLATGELDITANTDDTVILVARIGAAVETAEVATPAATIEATPAPTEVPETPEATATPLPETPEATEVAATPSPAPVEASPTPTEVLATAIPDSPQDIDSDDDGLDNSEEIALGSDPDNPDTDNDGLSDGVEELVLITDPLNPDTDDDGVTDGQELELGTDPLNIDSDDDLLYDGGEIIYETDPLNPDTDGDGLTDGDEVYFYETDPTEADTDGDGVNDYEEVFGGGSTTQRGEVVQLAVSTDSDNDGLTNAQEARFGTDPLVWDNDGDGVNDSNEIASSSDPNDPESYP